MRRLTRTTMVFCIFAAVTTPTSSLRCRRSAVAGAVFSLLSIRVLPQFPFPKQGFYARQIAAGQTKPGNRFGLSGVELKAQAEQLLRQFAFARLEFRRSQVAHFIKFAWH